MVTERSKHATFYGTATLGERGQIVIPAEARKTLNLGKGEKLLIFGAGPDMLSVVRLSTVERLATKLSDRLEVIRRVVEQGRD
ncbi:MAG: AbrB/MazE/SpoVT family DNA-binding domain-containing protein [Candidatus Neomarinimicrobiota bacterium]